MPKIPILPEILIAMAVQVRKSDIRRFDPTRQIEVCELESGIMIRQSSERRLRRMMPDRAIIAFTFLCACSGRLFAQADQSALPPAPAVAGQSEVAPAQPAPNARAVELWQDKPLNQLTASIARPESDAKLSEPETVRLSQASAILKPEGSYFSPIGDSRPWMMQTYEWEAPATRHLPLLFEEPNLERLGYTYTCRTWGGGSVSAGDCIQPFISAAHFFGRIPMIPYMCGVNPPCEPVYTLGVDRPGSPVPYRRHYLPVSLKGALYEAGAVVGMFYCIP